MKPLYANNRGESISIKLKTFCEKRRITLKYAVLYIHEENGLIERKWQTIVTIKDSLLLDNGLLLNFWADAMNTSNYF